VIAHFDIDAFYASVAQLDDPSLAGKPLAVAGSSRRAVVLTASYEARPFGVRSAIPLYQALERCPQLIVVPPNFPRYRELSNAVFGVFARGGGAVEGLSLDEAYVDALSDDPQEALAFAVGVRASVRYEVGLVVSAGVATSKMVAKIASDSVKPDGCHVVEPGTERAYLAPMPIGRLSGVGPKTQARLEASGVATIGDLAGLDDDGLVRLFGRHGREMRDLACGIDPRRVVSERETQSVSSEQTFEYDLRTHDELRAALVELSEDVAQRLASHGLRGASVGIKVTRSNFTTIVRQTQLREPTNQAQTIARAAEICLSRAPLEGQGVRLLGVRAASLTATSTAQLTLLDS
jgi:DNA polymerase-4